MAKKSERPAWTKELARDIADLHCLCEGEKTEEIRNAIGQTTLHFIMRTYRLMEKLPRGLGDEEIRKSLVIIGKQCRKILGKPLLPDKRYTKATEELPEYTPEKLFEHTLAAEAYEMLEVYHGKDFSEAYQSRRSRDRHKHPDYVSHYLVYALDFFLRKADITDNKERIAAFYEEQEIKRNTDGLTKKKHVKENYLDCYDIKFLHRLRDYYDQQRYTIVSRQGLNETQYCMIVDEVDGFDKSTISRALFFPPWDEVFPDPDKKKGRKKRPS